MKICFRNEIPLTFPTLPALNSPNHCNATGVGVSWDVFCKISISNEWEWNEGMGEKENKTGLV